MSKLILVLGGAKSGKSFYAEKLVKDSLNVVYIATAEVRDDEMSRRVKNHQKRRPVEWQTIEAPFELKEALSGCDKTTEYVIVDCVTIFITNQLLKYEGVDDDASDSLNMVVEQIKVICDSAKKIDATVIMVSNEVGFGIVPENRLARVFRDLAGKVNQVVASMSDEVFFVIAGIAQKIK